MSRLLKSHYNSIYRLTYHLVLVTKNGRKCFTGAMLDRLKEIITDLC
ncbi:transposase [Psychrobacter pasteurii]